MISGILLSTIVTDLENMIKGSEDWSFHWEIILRTVIMFLIILAALSVLGKRGVKQLSVFELVIIISFGSAAGDPMFYKDVGILNAITVLAVIVLLYKVTTYFVFKSERIGKMIEGEPIILIEDGKFSIANFDKEPLGYDEFFAEMRVNSVSHLGQVERAIIEVSGEISLFYFEDKDVGYGLPILPNLYSNKHCQILSEGIFSCSFCANTETIKPTDSFICPECGKKEWVKSINKLRIT